MNKHRFLLLLWILLGTTLLSAQPQTTLRDTLPEAVKIENESIFRKCFLSVLPIFVKTHDIPIIYRHETLFYYLSSVSFVPCRLLKF